MKENQVKRRMYITPQIEIARIKMSCHLLEASYPGQHNPAQKGGEVGEDPAGQNDARIPGGGTSVLFPHEDHANAIP